MIVRYSCRRALQTFVVGFACIVFFGSSGVAHAADLLLSPSSSTIRPGAVKTLDVQVSSPDQAVNAFAGSISFPSDVLEVVSLSKTNSIVDLWVREPSFSNELGEITFEGVALNPAFTGTRGKIVEIRFRSKKVGVAAVSFASGQVLAHDGAGTNVLKLLRGASLSVVPVSPKVPDVEQSAIDTDTEPPEPFTVQIRSEDGTPTRMIAAFQTTDDASGIEYYEIKIGDRDFIVIQESGAGEVLYPFSVESPGTYRVVVRAYDAAGNSTESVTQLVLMGGDPKSLFFMQIMIGVLVVMLAYILRHARPIRRHIK